MWDSLEGMWKTKFGRITNESLVESESSPNNLWVELSISNGNKAMVCSVLAIKIQNNNEKIVWK